MPETGEFRVGMYSRTNKQSQSLSTWFVASRGELSEVSWAAQVLTENKVQTDRKGQQDLLSTGKATHVEPKWGPVKILTA
jgi:hypothetical protein